MGRRRIITKNVEPQEQLKNVIEKITLQQKDIIKESLEKPNDPKVSSTLQEVFLWQLSQTAPYCLCEVHQLPEWQFQHRRMNYGYRSVSTFSGALWSLFYFHNEFINIWLHYLGTLALLWKTWTYYQHYASEISSSTFEYQLDFYILFLCTLLGNCLPILTSGLCHHFYCINQQFHMSCWFLDFLGMLSGITFVSSNFMYITFYCIHHPEHRIHNELSVPAPTSPPLLSTFSIYHQLLALLLGGYIAAMYWCWRQYRIRLSKPVLQPKDRFPEFSSTLTMYSVFIYSLSIGWSVLLHPQYLTDPVLSQILLRSALYPAAMGLGIVIFAQGAIPERLNSLFGLPSYFFDFIGHSHQCWHVVSFVVLYYWIDVIFHHYDVRESMSCANMMM